MPVLLGIFDANFMRARARAIHSFSVPFMDDYSIPFVHCDAVVRQA